MQDLNHLLAACSKEIGALLNALSVSSLGLRMDDETTRCPQTWNSPLSPPPMNTAIHRSLSPAKPQSRMEPMVMCRSHGKCPDWSFISSWSGKVLVQDVTCPDTYAPHRHLKLPERLVLCPGKQSKGNEATTSYWSATTTVCLSHLRHRVCWAMECIGELRWCLHRIIREPC